MASVTDSLTCAEEILLLTLGDQVSRPGEQIPFTASQDEVEALKAMAGRGLVTMPNNVSGLDATILLPALTEKGWRIYQQIKRPIRIDPDIILVRRFHLFEDPAVETHPRYSGHGKGAYILVPETVEPLPASIQDNNLGFRCRREDLLKLAGEIQRKLGKGGRE